MTDQFPSTNAGQQDVEGDGDPEPMITSDDEQFGLDDTEEETNQALRNFGMPVVGRVIVEAQKAIQCKCKLFNGQRCIEQFREGELDALR